MPSKKRILVSRNLKVGSLLRAWSREHEHQLIEAPFIRIDPILNLKIPSTDWVFFSSPNGLDVYFNNYPLLAPKIGVYGSATQLRLRERGLKADFVGDTTKSPSDIGNDFFKSIKENDSILFPQSQLSKKSILGANKTNTCIERVIYHTILVGHEMPTIDVAVLTSPSNIDGFLLENEVGDTQFIVLGETSKNHFEKLALTNRIAVPLSANEKSIILLLESLL